MDQTSAVVAQDVAEKPNFPMAVVAGIGAAIAGALIWAVITVVSEMQLGIVAVAVGFLIGWAIGAVGKGSGAQFGILGAACGVLGCVLGSTFTAIGLFASA